MKKRLTKIDKLEILMELIDEASETIHCILDSKLSKAKKEKSYTKIVKILEKGIKNIKKDNYSD